MVSIFIAGVASSQTTQPFVFTAATVNNGPAIAAFTRAEEKKRDASEKRSNRRVDHMAPFKVAGVVESEELVAVEAVLVIEENVENDVGKSEERYPGEGAEGVAIIDLIPMVRPDYLALRMV